MLSPVQAWLHGHSEAAGALFVEGAYALDTYKVAGMLTTFIQTGSVHNANKWGMRKTVVYVFLPPKNSFNFTLLSLQANKGMQS